MSNSTLLTLLKIFAVLAGLSGVVQMVTGFGWLSLPMAHGRLAEAGFVILLVASVFAWMWSRRSGEKGLFMHAAGMAVVALVQIAIGHMDMRTVHIAIGIFYLVGVVALATLSFRASEAQIAAPVDRSRLQG